MMIDFLLQATLSNLLIAGALALIAWQVQKRIASASLPNLLWALVLVKLITPPVVSIPVLQVPSFTSNTAQADAYEAALLAPGDSTALLDLDSANARLGTAEQSAAITAIPWSSIVAPAMLLVWVLGSVTLLLISAYRVLRFHLLLRANSSEAEPRLISLADQVTRRISLRSRPKILVTSANIAPFVWWQQGRAAVVVSKATTRQLSQLDLENVLAHEMAHIKRCDHWMRWLEWSCLVALWWNPLMWLARNQLRLFEEMACDELVIRESQAPMQQYANSLLNMAELLAASTLRPPVVASAFNSGGHLEKRLKAMLNQSWKVPPAMRLAILGLAFCLFPMGLVVAQDFGAIEKRLGGAVEAGEITLEQAFVMMEALRDSVGHDHRDGMRELEERFRRGVDEIQAAVKAGKLSEEDAERKIAEIKEAIEKESEEIHNESRERDFRLGHPLIEADLERSKALKSRYKEYAEEIKKSLESGKLSEEDAERKMLEIRKKIEQVRLATEYEKEETAAKQRAYLADLYSQRLKAAVEQGDTSEGEAKKLLLEYKKKMTHEDRAAQEERVETELLKRFDFDLSAVEKGDISAEQVEKKALELHKLMFPFSFDDKPLREKEFSIEIRAKKDGSDPRYLRAARDSIEAKIFSKKLAEKRKKQAEEEKKKANGKEKPIAKGTPLIFDYTLTPLSAEEQKIFSFFMGFTRQ